MSAFLKVFGCDQRLSQNFRREWFFPVVVKLNAFDSSHDNCGDKEKFSHHPPPFWGGDSRSFGNPNLLIGAEESEMFRKAEKTFPGACTGHQTGSTTSEILRKAYLQKHLSALKHIDRAAESRLDQISDSVSNPGST